MSATLQPASVQTSDDSLYEFSIADVLRTRAEGVDFRVAAKMFAGAVEHFESKGHNLYRRTLLQPSDAEALVEYAREGSQRQMIMLASNNYLGLAAHPQVIRAACEAAVNYGAGAGSSPLLVGTFPTTRNLEAKLARFKGAEEACVFAAGYSANVGVISAVAGKNDVVILDAIDSARDHSVTSSQPPEDLAVQLGLVNLLSRPVVLDVSRDQATLRTVLAMLRQPVGGAAQVTIVRPSGGPQSISLSPAVDVPLASGSVLVFDPATVNPGLLPRLPATVPVLATLAAETAPPAPVRESTPKPALVPEAMLQFATRLPTRIDEPARIDSPPETGPHVLLPGNSTIPPAARRSARVQPAAAHAPTRLLYPASLVFVGCLVLSAILLRQSHPALFARVTELATRPPKRLCVWLVRAISDASPAGEDARDAPPESEFAGYSLQESADPIDAVYALAGPHYSIEAPEPAGNTTEVEQELRPASVTKPSRKFRIDGGHLTGKPGALDRALSALDEERS
jgi:hypothetical protein